MKVIATFRIYFGFSKIKTNSSEKPSERDLYLGIGMGKTCEPKAFSFQCMTKFTTKKKRKKLKTKEQCNLGFIFLNRRTQKCSSFVHF